MVALYSCSSTLYSVRLQGFPYVWELYVSSHVLRAMSLASLLATILTFTVLPYVFLSVSQFTYPSVAFQNNLTLHTV